MSRPYRIPSAPEIQALEQMFCSNTFALYQQLLEELARLYEAKGVESLMKVPAAYLAQRALNDAANAHFAKAAEMRLISNWINEHNDPVQIVNDIAQLTKTTP